MAAEFLQIDWSDAELVVKTVSRKSLDLSFLIDRERPQFLDETSYQMLSMITGNLFRLAQYPESLQASLRVPEA